LVQEVLEALEDQEVRAYHEQMDQVYLRCPSVLLVQDDPGKNRMEYYFKSIKIR
jgi:hypothetical protein